MVEDIKELTIGGETVKVEDTSKEVQDLVSTYNEWRRTAVEDEKRFRMSHAALQELQRQIVQTYQQSVSDNTTEDPSEEGGNEA